MCESEPNRQAELPGNSLTGLTPETLNQRLRDIKKNIFNRVPILFIMTATSAMLLYITFQPEIQSELDVKRIGAIVVGGITLLVVLHAGKKTIDDLGEIRTLRTALKRGFNVRGFGFEQIDKPH